MGRCSPEYVRMTVTFLKIGKTLFCTLQNVPFILTTFIMNTKDIILKIIVTYIVRRYIIATTMYEMIAIIPNNREIYCQIYFVVTVR